jgi:hypothetical protein
VREDGGVPDDFLIARNPDPDSTLPYLVRIPLGPDGVVLKVEDTWPRTSKVYCHRAEGWPPDAEVVERVPTRVCTSRGAAIDLVLDRGRENLSQFVLTNARGRPVIFWQSARTAKQARPNVRLPTARAASVAGAAPDVHDSPVELVIDVDVHERYAWKFSHQQATTCPAPLAAGDYAVTVDGRVVAAVERKTLQDLVSSLLDGKLRFALAELSGLPHAAVVVEDRYSQVFRLTFARPAVVADAIAECHVRFPSVPIVFAETRALAQEWTYRFLAAAREEALSETGAQERLADLAPAGAVPAAAPTSAQVRAWALEHGYAVSDRGACVQRSGPPFGNTTAPDPTSPPPPRPSRPVGAGTSGYPEPSAPTPARPSVHPSLRTPRTAVGAGWLAGAHA